MEYVLPGVLGSAALQTWIIWEKINIKNERFLINVNYPTKDSYESTSSMKCLKEAAIRCNVSAISLSRYGCEKLDIVSFVVTNIAVW